MQVSARHGFTVRLLYESVKEGSAMISTFSSDRAVVRILGTNVEF
jgi:hypothetical protein